MQTTIDPRFLVQTSAPSTPSAPTVTETSRTRLWISRVMTGLPSLLFAWDGVSKFFPYDHMIEAWAKMGYAVSTFPVTGTTELLAALLLSFRRTAPLGAALFTAFLGGAVATHVRQGDPLVNHVLPVLFAVVIWSGLYLRDERVRALSPFSAR